MFIVLLFCCVFPREAYDALRGPRYRDSGCVTSSYVYLPPAPRPLDGFFLLKLNDTTLSEVKRTIYYFQARVVVISYMQEQYFSQ